MSRVQVLGIPAPALLPTIVAGGGWEQGGWEAHGFGTEHGPSHPQTINYKGSSSGELPCQGMRQDMQWCEDRGGIVQEPRHRTEDWSRTTYNGDFRGVTWNSNVFMARNTGLCNSRLDHVSRWLMSHDLKLTQVWGRPLRFIGSWAGGADFWSRK